MLVFIKNHFYRMASKKNYIIVSLVMTIVATSLAVVLSKKMDIKGKIAVVTVSRDEGLKSDYIKFIYMEDEPNKSDLVLGKYDGVLIDKGNGNYEVNTIKGDDYKKIIEEVIKDPKGFKPESNNIRGIGTNILGYLQMFILIQTFTYMFLLSEDREQKQIERIATSPISLFKYMLSYFIAIFLLVFVPSFFVIVIIKYIFGISIGFSLIQYAGLLTLIASLGISFAMLLNLLLKVGDTANMVGSSIVVLTTVLSGSFYSFEGSNKILESALWILPQKDFLSFVQGLESGTKISSMIPQLAYILILILAFYTISSIKIKKYYILTKK